VKALEIVDKLVDTVLKYRPPKKKKKQKSKKKDPRTVTNLKKA
jgi:hypothetical protein